MINKIKKMDSANIIASLALMISIFSTVLNEYRYYESEQESLRISVKEYKKEYPVTFSTKGPGGSGLINTVWVVSVTNTGKQTLSLTESEFWYVQNGNAIQYPLLSNGLQDESSSPASLPISLEPGTSRRFYAEICLPLGVKASEVMNKAPFRSRHSLKSLNSYLKKEAGIGIFDEEGEENNSVAVVDKDKRDILIEFISASENSFRQSASGRTY